MKKTKLTAICAVLLLACFSLSAQVDTKKFSVGFGLEAGKPTGDVKDSYNFTGGITVRFSYKAGPGFATFTTGAVGYVPKKGLGHDTKAALQIPFKAGYKFIFAQHVFVMGELGYSVYRYYYDDVNNNLASASTGGFTFAPSVGVNFGVFEAGLKYESIAISGGTVSDIGIRLGFNF
jgi:hypothetical protein